jgi:hypothetical protein
MNKYRDSEFPQKEVFCYSLELWACSNFICAAMREAHRAFSSQSWISESLGQLSAVGQGHCMSFKIVLYLQVPEDAAAVG